MQRYSAANAAVGTVQRLHGMAGALYDYGAQTVPLSNGGYVVMWQGDTSDGQSTDVFFQRFDASGSTVGGLQRLQGELEGQRMDVFAHIKALPDGGFVIAWTNGDGWNGSDVPADTVFVTRYDAQGQVVQNPGAPLVVDTASPVFANGSSHSMSLYAPSNLWGFYDAQATANGGVAEAVDIGVVYRLGGADAALFNIDSKSGMVSFKAAPNAADATYNFSITAIDIGGNTATQDLSVTIQALPPSPAMRLQGMAGALSDGHSQITAMKDGGYVVTWDGETSDGQNRDLFLQRYDAANAAVGTVQRLHGMTGALSDYSPQTTSLSDGGFVVTWYGNTSDGQYFDIFVQRYSAANAAVGTLQRLRGTASHNSDYDPQTTALSDGGYVVTWQGDTSDGQYYDIFVQRYDAANAAVGTVQRMQGMAGNLDDDAPQTTALSDGGYVVTWQGRTSDGQYSDIFVQRYSAANAAVGTVQRLHGMAGDLYDAVPQITALSDGGFVVTWNGDTSDGQNRDIFVQRFSAANAAVGAVKRLHGLSGDSYDHDPQTTALSDGGYVVVWQDFDICVQRFAADNAPVGDVFRMQGASGVQWDSTPQVAALADGGFAVTWSGDTSDGQSNDVFVQRFDAQGHAIAENGLAVTSSAQAFTLWQEAELAWQDVQKGVTGSTHDINALNTHSMAIMQQHDTTSRDGSANQADAAKRLTQWVDQVTGTDVVSQAEHQSGFSITGHAAAGSSGTIKFYLDNDRTDGTNQVGTQLQNGVNGVHIAYNNTSGDYILSFDANSIMLKPATHSVWGSGIHQLTVDTDGNGAMNGAEASRLFLVADGTAHSSDTGTVAQNYSVQDKITGDAFVYYFGDPDGAGVGLSTPLDNSDTNANTGVVMTDKDTTVGGVYGDYDYYTSNVGSTVPAATAANTALHLVTNIAAQTWEFHMATQTTTGNQIETTWDQNNTLAINHVLFDSNTSRVASFQEAVALYAANFGGANGGENTQGSTVAGAVQPIGNETWVNDRTPTAAEDNHPRYWDHDIWTAATLPGGHAVLDLYYANAVVFPTDFTQHGITVVM